MWDTDAREVPPRQPTAQASCTRVARRAARQVRPPAGTRLRYARDQPTSDRRRRGGRRRAARIAAWKHCDKRASRREIICARRVRQPRARAAPGRRWSGSSAAMTPRAAREPRRSPGRRTPEATVPDTPAAPRRGCPAATSRLTSSQSASTGTFNRYGCVSTDRAPRYMRTRWTCALIVTALPRSPYSASASCSVVIPSGCIASTASSSSERSPRSRRAVPSRTLASCPSNCSRRRAGRGRDRRRSQTIAPPSSKRLDLGAASVRESRGAVVVVHAQLEPARAARPFPARRSPSRFCRVARSAVRRPLVAASHRSRRRSATRSDVRCSAVSAASAASAASGSVCG